MEKLAIGLKLAKLYSHASHNLLGGPTFFQDHSFLGELYETYDSEFDSIAERAIGKSEDMDLVQVNLEAAQMLSAKGLPKNYEEAFSFLLVCEKAITEHIEVLAKEGYGQGCVNLLASIADASEVRQYKLQKRLGM